jgi:hypothetical protein
LESLKGIDHREVVGLDQNIILKFFLGKYLRKVRVGIWKRVAIDRDTWGIITGAVKAGIRL